MARRGYDVLADGKVVGRIYEDASASTPPDMRWFWSITAIAPGGAERDEGPRTDARSKVKFQEALKTLPFPACLSVQDSNPHLRIEQKAIADIHEGRAMTF
jgi:hypothetical protein